VVEAEGARMRGGDIVACEIGQRRGDRHRVEENFLGPRSPTYPRARLPSPATTAGTTFVKVKVELLVTI